MAVQQVVEVVGDAAGELADGLHLLGLRQLQLELLLLGDVHQIGHQRPSERGEIELGDAAAARRPAGPPPGRGCRPGARPASSRDVGSIRSAREWPSSFSPRAMASSAGLAWTILAAKGRRRRAGRRRTARRRPGRPGSRGRGVGRRAAEGAASGGRGPGRIYRRTRKVPCRTPTRGRCSRRRGPASCLALFAAACGGQGWVEAGAAGQPCGVVGSGRAKHHWPRRRGLPPRPPRPARRARAKAFSPGASRLVSGGRSSPASPPPAGASRTSSVVPPWGRAFHDSESRR